MTAGSGLQLSQQHGGEGGDGQHAQHGSGGGGSAALWEGLSAALQPTVLLLQLLPLQLRPHTCTDGLIVGVEVLDLQADTSPSECPSPAQPRAPTSALPGSLTCSCDRRLTSMRLRSYGTRDTTSKVRKGFSPVGCCRGGQKVSAAHPARCSPHGTASPWLCPSPPAPCRALGGGRRYLGLRLHHQHDVLDADAELTVPVVAGLWGQRPAHPEPRQHPHPIPPLESPGQLWAVGLHPWPAPRSSPQPQCSRSRVGARTDGCEHARSQRHVVGLEAHRPCGGHGVGYDSQGQVCPPPSCPIPPPVLTLMHRQEIADAVPGSVAVVEPHFPERPAGKGLHCSPWRMRRWNRAGSSSGTPALLPPHRLHTHQLCPMGRRGGRGRCCPSAHGCRLPIR